MFTFAIGESARKSARARQDQESDVAPIDSVRLSHGEVLRSFDFHREDPEKLISLKEIVYDKPVNRQAFEWEYFAHPQSKAIRVFVVEHNGEILAATTRLPAKIRHSGADLPAYFNVDSMVHPAHRRSGHMRDLYEFARTHLDSSALLFSKGSSAQIYPLLMRIGHHEIVPNTALVSYPSAARWLMSRLRLRTPSSKPRRVVPAGFDDYRAIDRFDHRFDAFFERVSKKFSTLFYRDAAFMNWRYLDISHRRYMCFQREVAGEIASVLVLSVNGEQGQIVDLLWDADQADEPERDIRFAQALFDEHEVVRVACFGTHPRLRDILGSSGFLDRGETPRFSVCAPPELDGLFAAGAELHVVDGDGDTEFS
jgi:hypothetical protein